MKESYKNCVRCGRCTGICRFLKKYGMDLQGFAARLELAYHCFLCGACGRVCPMDIDGRAIALTLRRRRLQEGYRPEQNGCALLMLEKQSGLFRNYKRGRASVVLFPGCNFPAYFPRTMTRLALLLKEKAGIGILYDCCGKPLADLGLAEAEASILSKIEAGLECLGVKTLITLCPNCFYFLKDRLRVKVRFIYETLAELGLRQKHASDGSVFLPCPDRDTEALFASLTQFFLPGQIRRIDTIQCCGLGGCAGVKEPALAKELQQAFTHEPGIVYTYCASCTGRIAAGGTNTAHLLCSLLAISEKPAVGIASLPGRIACRFR